MSDKLRRWFQDSGEIFADEQPVKGAGLNEINREYLNTLIQEKMGASVDSLKIPITNQLENLGFYRKGNLSLSGLLLLSDHVQKFKPSFSVKCISFDGTEVSALNYKDREDAFQGNLVSLYKQSLSFLKRNLKNIQVEESFNSRPRLEIAKETLEELIVNALVHRNYFIPSEIKIFVFEDRVEIISPGTLPNTLSIENIKAGTSVVRNPILYSNAPFLLPLVGVGSGIPRALKKTPDLELINDTDRNVFIAKIGRKS